MAEYIRCRECDSLYCKGCNLKNLETMLRNGKFDCIMNENRCINTATDVAPVVHGQWEKTKEWATKAKYRCSVCGREIMSAVKVNIEKYPYCHCGAKMDGCNESEN